MTQLLVIGPTILAVGPFTEDAESVHASDITFPKHVMPDWTIVDAALPDKFNASGYTWDGAVVVAKAPPPLDRDALVVKIDNAVKAIYEKAAPPVIGDIYKEREAAAQAFKNGGYVGTVPTRVSEFQVPAGVSAQVATDLILSQAAQLHTAKDTLEALRMRKYEVKNAASDTLAQSTADSILTTIAFIDKNLP